MTRNGIPHLKQAQISIFLILAFVIMTSAGLLAYLNTNDDDIQTANFDVKPAIDFIELCLTNVGKNAAVFISEHGGYYTLPANHYNTSEFDLPYYFYHNVVLNPGKSEIEEQISKYIEDNLNSCLRDFQGIQEYGYNIQMGKNKVKSIIVPYSLVLTLESPIRIQRSETSRIIENIRVQLESINLDKIINFNNLIMNAQSNRTSAVCLSCITNHGADFELQILLAQLDDDILLFTIVDNTTIINQLPLIFNFVNQYDNYSCANLPLDDLAYVQYCANERIRELINQ